MSSLYHIIVVLIPSPHAQQRYTALGMVCTLAAMPSGRLSLPPSVGQKISISHMSEW